MMRAKVTTSGWAVAEIRDRRRRLLEEIARIRGQIEARAQNFREETRTFQWRQRAMTKLAAFVIEERALGDQLAARGEVLLGEAAAVLRAFAAEGVELEDEERATLDRIEEFLEGK